MPQHIIYNAATSFGGFQVKDQKMENQHKLIKGYRELSQVEIDLMNEIKAKGEEIGALIERLNESHRVEYEAIEFEADPANFNEKAAASADEKACAVDEADRWMGIGKEHIQLGIMALVRAIARPTSF